MIENHFSNETCGSSRRTGTGVRSKAEVSIDNWLYTRHLAHAYERRLPVPEDAYADFYVPLGECSIEYWGVEGSRRGARFRRFCEPLDPSLPL